MTMLLERRSRARISPGRVRQALSSALRRTAANLVLERIDVVWRREDGDDCGEAALARSPVVHLVAANHQPPHREADRTKPVWHNQGDEISSLLFGGIAIVAWTKQNLPFAQRPQRGKWGRERGYAERREDSRECFERVNKRTLAHHVVLSACIKWKQDDCVAL